MKVFISGYGSISSLGSNSAEMFENLLRCKTNIQTMPLWSNVVGLRTKLGAPAYPFESKSIPRTIRRTMSKKSEMSLLASYEALEQAGLSVKDFSNSKNQKNLICFGSTAASPLALDEYFKKYAKMGGPKGQLVTSFFKVMNHSSAANVAIGLGFKGPLFALSSACSTSAQSLVVAYELVKAGLYDCVLCGGSDELHEISAAIFDIAMAASTKYNGDPLKASRPFDKDRDGLVVSEGAGVLVIESEKSLNKRGGVPLVEILGGSYYCDGGHMSQPSRDAMQLTMETAVQKSGIQKKDISYINAHATSTMLGDVEESHAIFNAGFDETPVNSLKGHMGHSLAACGAIEAIASIKMMKKGRIISTRNLVDIGEHCANLNYMKQGFEMDQKIEHVLSNNFAFGGMNVSFVLKNI